MSRYRDDRAALEENIARLRAELDDAVERLDAIDGKRAAGEPDTEIDVRLGSDGALGVPSSIGLRADVDGPIDGRAREAIASLLRSRLGLSVNVGGSSVRSTDGRFVLETKDDRTELRLDWSFAPSEQRHRVATVAGAIGVAVTGATALQLGFSLDAVEAIVNMLWMVPVAGALLSPMLASPNARRVLHLQEQLRDTFRAAVDLAEGSDGSAPAPRYRVEEAVPASEPVDEEAGDFEGDTELGEDAAEDEAAEDEAAEDEAAEDEAAEDEAPTPR